MVLNGVLEVISSLLFGGQSDMRDTVRMPDVVGRSLEGAHMKLIGMQLLVHLPEDADRGRDRSTPVVRQVPPAGVRILHRRGRYLLRFSQSSGAGCWR